MFNKSITLEAMICSNVEGFMLFIGLNAFAVMNNEKKKKVRMEIFNFMKVCFLLLEIVKTMKKYET